MAWLEQHRSGVFHVAFRVRETRFKKSLGTKDRRKAESFAGRIEENLGLVKRGRLVIPSGADVATFLLSDGRIEAEPVVASSITIKALFDSYFANLPEGNLEPSTIQGMKIHQRQLFKHFGVRFEITHLSLADLQGYVKCRAGDQGLRGRKVTPTTIRKAIVTLRTVWNWGLQHGLVEKRFPNKGLKYPKTEEKPPFQAFAEIERQVNGLSAVKAADLWDCAFLTRPDIVDLLEHVKKVADEPFVSPMFVFAAHAGARRAEILRTRVTDIDLVNNRVTIRERKKSHESRTTRRVPLSPILRQSLVDWLAEHPGGELLFAHAKTAAGVSHDEAHRCFKRTLASSKFRHLRGWHVFRHSFCSNAAAAGIDQRIINEWVGHLSQAMERRYRHAVPDQQRAIELVYA